MADDVLAEIDAEFANLTPDDYESWRQYLLAEIEARGFFVRASRGEPGHEYYRDLLAISFIQACRLRTAADAQGLTCQPTPTTN